MQTFLPYPDFAQSARSLDDKRLGKQRVECMQILGALCDLRITTSGITYRKATSWVHHPAVLMWRGHEWHLRRYARICCDEWVARGFKDRIKPVLDSLVLLETPVPPWLGGPIHASHRASLLEKERWDLFLDHYKPLGWTDKWAGYFWPVQKETA